MNNVIIEIQQNKTGDLVGLKHCCRTACFDKCNPCDYYANKKRRPRETRRNL